MIGMNGFLDSEHSDDPVLAELVEELTCKLWAGDSIDLSEYAHRHPGHATMIRDLFPALERLVALGRSSATGNREGGGFSANFAPAALGDFRLIRQVGQGGMGLVYEAEQITLGRRVAIKLLPSARMCDPAQVARFEREARVAGRLQHGNIVPVFGMGREEGWYYYVMPFIAGRPLSEVLANVSRAATAEVIPRGGVTLTEAEPGSIVHDVGRFLFLEPAARAAPGGAVGVHSRPEPAGGVATQTLSWRAYFRNVARIGIGVADALEYAAGQGVIHRDIKPSNILIDDDGSPWVTDFGLARMTGDDKLTGSADVIGTLRYMGPERFRNQVDGRSDIYALGLTLYELLARQPAFPLKGRAALVAEITHGTLSPLLSLDPAIPRDLATVVHKAAAHEPNDRYQTAGELAADLRRFLEGRPVAARRPRPLGVAWRWCRRNPVVSALLGLLGLLIISMTAGATVAAYRFRAMARVEHQLRQTSDQARQDSERHAEESRAVLDFLTDDMLAAASPERAMGRVVTVEEALDRAEAAAAERFATQPLAEAAVRQTVGATYFKLGRYDRAEPQFRRARDLRAAHLGPRHADTLTSMHSLGDLYRDAGRWDEARALLEQVAENRRLVLGPDHPDTLTSRHFLGLLARDRKDANAARMLLETTLEARVRVLGPLHKSTLDTMNALSFALRELGHRDEARALTLKTLESRRRVLGPENPYTLDTQWNLARLDLESGRLGHAGDLFEQLYQSRRKVLGSTHPDTCDAACAVATSLAARGKWAEAASRYESVVATRPENLVYRFALATTRLGLGDLAAYDQHRLAMLRLADRVRYPGAGELVAKTLVVLPCTPAEALRACELARRDVQTHPGVAYFLPTWGAAKYRAGDLAEAASVLEDARRQVADTPAYRAQTDLFLAMTYTALHRNDEARDVLREAAALVESRGAGSKTANQESGDWWLDWTRCDVLLREASARASPERPPPPGGAVSASN